MNSLFHMYPSSEELYHYGVPGMRRGVRRKSQPTQYGYDSPTVGVNTTRDYSRKTNATHRGSFARGRVALTKRQTSTNPMSLSWRERNRASNDVRRGRRSSEINSRDLKNLMTGRLNRRRGTQDAYSKNGTDKASINRNVNKREVNTSKRRFSDMVQSYYDRGRYRINTRSTYAPRQRKTNRGK